AVKRVRQQLLQMLPGERRKRDLVYPSARTPDRLELPHQGMSVIDFVVAIRADQHEVLQFGTCQQIFQQVEGCRIEPLQVVERERKWMLGPCEHADESPEYELEASLCVLGRKVWDRRLFPQYELQLRHQVGHEPSVRAHRFSQGFSPMRE